MLGFFLGVEDLGYYENAEKLLNIPVGIISAIGSVMIPAFSKNQLSKQEFSKKMQQSFRLMIWLVFPMLIGLSILSKDIVIVLFGNNFIKSSTIIQLLSISVVFAAIANIIRTNYLIPFEKNSVYVTSTIFAALLNFIINLFLIPTIGVIGACVGTIIAEASVCLYQIYMTRNEINYFALVKLVVKYLIAS
ncbi:TPA: polysaccharide biosynthesis C-terminal domain-containing protein, partial [Streptococcus suis]